MQIFAGDRVLYRQGVEQWSGVKNQLFSSCNRDVIGTLRK